MHYNIDLANVEERQQTNRKICKFTNRKDIYIQI